jgi:hypothetical protein
MSNLAEYFAQHRPVPTWSFGERVFGKYKGIPFVGTTGGEGMVNETEGSLVTVFLDLPLKHNDTWHTTFIKVKPKDIKRLKSMDDEEPLKLPVAGSIPAKRTKQPRSKK